MSQLEAGAARALRAARGIRMIITIDGPAGSGKSTVARELARRLGVLYLDTGAMYRAVTLKAIEQGVNLDDEDALGRLAHEACIDLDCRPDRTRVLLDGRDVTDGIRTAEVSDRASYIARVAGVRTALVEKQRELGRRHGSLVTEGRDQGSVVFPEADAKFFLSASAEVRARRRHEEMIEVDPGVTYESVLAGIRTRDDRDSGRMVAPLVKPEGATEIDTSDLSIEEVTDRLHSEILARPR